MLGQLPRGAGKITDLARVDDRDRQAGSGERGGDDLLEPAGRFQHDQVRRKLAQMIDEVIKTGRVARHTKSLVGGMDMNVDMGFDDIDADENGLSRDLLHGDPSLQMRDRGASQATVRVHRQNNGRGPSLHHGLGVPRGYRGPRPLPTEPS